MIKIEFKFDSEYGQFCDALHLEDDHGLTDEQIEALKKQRFDNWIAVITTVSEEVPQVTQE